MEAVSFPQPYQSRQPADGVLYQTLADHLETFLFEREQEHRPLPAYISEELHAYLRCGIHHYGFLRVCCPDSSCGFEHAVPFSCKKRGFCPSCGAKCAAATEEYLIDNLLPLAPYRQYVLTFPYSLRYLLAWDADLLSAVHKVVIDRIYRFIRDLLGEQFLRKEFFPGSITFVQRFGSLLNPMLTTAVYRKP